jgi:hypothetical protein
VAGWGGQEAHDGGVIGAWEGGEVEDSHRVEERVGFGVRLAAGEADCVRGGEGEGRWRKGRCGGGRSWAG